MKSDLPEIAALIKKLGLKPLKTEGGLFVRTYCCDENIPAAALPQRLPPKARAFGSAILFLLTAEPDSFSALHWLPSDEIYHFYLGDPVGMLMLHPDGSSQRVILGQDILHEEKVQHVVPHGVIQGSRLLPGGRFALIGTSMAPGFDESDYHGCERMALLAKYPSEAEWICRLTRPESSLKMASDDFK